MPVSLEEWFQGLDDGRVEDIDIAELRSFLEAHGANFSEIKEEDRASLRKFTNKGKADGMNAVWGDMFARYKAWADSVAEEYDTETLRTLKKPSGAESSESRVAGLRAFFGELTALAAGAMTLDEYRRYAEVRLQNGILIAQGRKDDRIKIETPTSEGAKIRIASVPVGFPSRLWNKIQTWSR